MKNAKYLTIGLLLCCVGLISSCKKEGCTDQNARTYDEKADNNDPGMCKYERKLVFGASKNAATYMAYWGESTVTVKINGATFGSFNIYDYSRGGFVYYSTSELECDLTSFVLNKTYDLGSESSREVLIQFLDEDGYEIPGTQNSTFISGSQSECSMLAL